MLFFKHKAPKSEEQIVALRTDIEVLKAQFARLDLELALVKGKLLKKLGGKELKNDTNISENVFLNPDGNIL